MDQRSDRRLLESDWYSPRRLHDSPTQLDFPGDRFIPSRSLMDLDQAHSLLTNNTRQFYTSKYSAIYKQKLVENLTQDSTGRPFRMLVFRGSPKSTRKSIRLVDEMRREEAMDKNTHKDRYRSLPKVEERILDAPKLVNDYYINVLHWGSTNILAVALGPAVYLWNSENRSAHKLFQIEEENDHITSVSWSPDGKNLAVGHFGSKLQLWDAETSKPVRSLEGHTKRVASTAWNGHILTSGSRDKSIINHDVRARYSWISIIKAHKEEVCGLSWSSGGSQLASGGNENLVYIWEASKMSYSSSNYLHKLDEHCSAVKALSWCPYQSHILASGGGTRDGCIKIWNLQKGTCINTIDTKAQIQGLEWNRHHKEIMSGHGYGTDSTQNKLCLWRYPSMCKVREFGHHKSRIINICQSADGLTVVSAGADETLRFWSVFGPPAEEKASFSELDGILSFKTSLIR